MSENLRLILITAASNVCYWHKADITRLSFNLPKRTPMSAFDPKRTLVATPHRSD